MNSIIRVMFDTLNTYTVQFTAMLFERNEEQSAAVLLKMKISVAIF